MKKNTHQHTHTDGLRQRFLSRPDAEGNSGLAKLTREEEEEGEEGRGEEEEGKKEGISALSPHPSADVRILLQDHGWRECRCNI